MSRKVLACVLLIVAAMLVANVGQAATEQQKQAAIDAGLAYLAGSQLGDGHWAYSNNGELAATGSAALAFIEEGYLPNDGSIYGDVVGKAVNYIFNRATVQSGFGWETAGYPRHAEDYNNDGILNDGGNNQALYFNPGNYNRNVYTTGIVTPVVYALGEALGRDTTVGVGSVTSSMTYEDVMQDIVDWFSFAQVEPNRGNSRGGWRYYANQTTSDNSTAQWGALPLLYGDLWGLPHPDYVEDELELWINYVQNPNGGSGYDNPYTYVNVAKTGGLLLELKVIGADENDPRVIAAQNFINSRWNTGPGGTWYGNLGLGLPAVWLVKLSNLSVCRREWPLSSDCGFTG
ncbi:MAG: hypothetical protein HQ567_12530 [Candidatus Nealsonbacteria bacterium]|nr:hypothetical protein [Candidatus Nealsonbacteria bacterium]